MDSRDFTKAMTERSDEELYEIVHFGSEDGFVPDAIKAAKNDFNQRNLDSEQEVEIAHAIENKHQQKKLLAEKPLSWPARIAFFILPLGFLPIFILAIVAASLESKGYGRKSSEAYRWMGVGVAFWIGLGIALFILSRVFR